MNDVDARNGWDEKYRARVFLLRVFEQVLVAEQ
jgi:hypothetical protein